MNAPQHAAVMPEVPLCASDELLERGKGVRFPVSVGAREAVGFAIRYNGVAYGYLNRCAHVPVEMDWGPGEFFESSGNYLMCATHGALYLPDTGKCTAGPCHGARLHKICVIEKDGRIFWSPDDYVRPVIA
jgi:nitrite reductase/ring-hydroxylating ferredoxin subunit